jgi:putative DNA methylase
MPTKLIESTLPLTAINEATAAEKRKTARLAHPAKVHQWWARRPLAASRAVLFAQLVDDPGPGPERDRLFDILRSLVTPEGPSDEVLRAAKEAIRQSVGDDITVLDPFAGGGAIPIEAQRLGLHVEASDLNPVAVLLNRLVLDQVKAALNRPPVRPTDDLLMEAPASGLRGLEQDICWYGDRLRSLAVEQLGDLYPDCVDDTGKRLPVVAWLWARTTPCPNPACRIDAPLVRSFVLSKKKGRESWVDPVTEGPGHSVEFVVRSGRTPRVKGTVGRSGATCVACQTAIPLASIREQGRNGQIRECLMAVVGLGDRRRLYFSPTVEHQDAALVDAPTPFATELARNPRNINVHNYGFLTHADLFTPRQLRSLVALVNLLPSIREEVLRDSGNDQEYADLVVTVLAVVVSKLTDTSNSFCRWLVKDEVPVGLFARQAIAMVWDFPEANLLGKSSGSLHMTVRNVARSLTGDLATYERSGMVTVGQANAATREYPSNVVVSTDPPYFDNITYADLADFFYVWLRLGLKDLEPDLFATLLTPKAEELVATPYRFEGGQKEANEHFESGFKQCFANVLRHHHPDVPMTVFYAYKQEDSEAADEGGGTGAGATGWEKLLQSMVDTGMRVTATWPIRTEMPNRMIGLETNALASSVVLACRPRSEDAGVTDRQGFIRHLRRELVSKLAELHAGGIQPVDMAQASIGPGMAVFTSYSRVVEAGDQSMSVGTALQIINQVLDELQSEQEGDLDPYTRWAVTWFDQFGMNAGDFGDAQNIATARGTAMNAIDRSGIVESRAGRVRLLDRSEYPDDWDPTTDKTLTVWEICQHIIRRLDGDGGVHAAAELLRQSGGLAESARDLSYRLYEIANRRGWAEEARGYNNMAAEWPGLVAAAAQSSSDSKTLF